MRHTKQHTHYCGIDLHTTKMYLCILSQEGDILFHRNIKTEPATFLKTIAPYRDDLVVCAECMCPPQLKMDIQAVCIKGVQGAVLSPLGLIGL